MLSLLQDKLVFPGPPPGVQLAAAPPDNAESIWLGEGDHRTEAWLFRAPGASAASPAPAVIFFHGNGEVIDFNEDIARGYSAMGWSVLMPEYPGYGRTPGKPSQESIVAAAERAFDWLKSREDVDSGRIVLHGRSLGGGAAFQLAARRRVRAVIAQSTFTSIAKIARGMFVPSFLVRHPFRSDDIVKSLDTPILLIHGVEDTIIPVKHSRALAAIAKNATLVEVRAGHNDLPRDEREYWAVIAKFLSGAR